MRPKTIVFDLDGTLCEERPTFERPFAEPIPEAVQVVRKLHKTGNRIIIYTARSWSEYALTERWLLEHGVPFNLLLCGKPIADAWVDDRAITPHNWGDVAATLGAL